MAPTNSTAHERRAHFIAPAGRALGLSDLPVELIERIARCFDDVRDLAAANATSRLFRGAPGGRSPVEHALRERARARGHARALPPALPPIACSWSDELFARELVAASARAHSAVVACSYNFSAFVDAEGGLYTCGEEEEEAGEPRAHAALGHGGDHVDVVCVPMLVATLATVRVRAVAAGGLHLLALSEAGAVYGCGSNRFGELGLGDTTTRRSFAAIAVPRGDVYVGLAAGAYHSLALTAAGCAYSWGYNYHGQLGHGHRKERWEPTRIKALDGVRIGGVAAGERHALLLTTSGAVYSWGDGVFGRLGHGDQQEQHTPRRIEALAGVRAVHVSAGDGHSLVVDAAGGVHTFGRGWAGCLGHGDDRTLYLPKRVEALSGVVRAVRASAGVFGSAVLGADGSVHAFGDNSNGQLGLGVTVTSARQPTRVVHHGQTRVTDCALGMAHSLHVTADGSVYSCGAPSAALGLGLTRATDPSSAAHALTRIVHLPRVQPFGIGGSAVQADS